MWPASTPKTQRVPNGVGWPQDSFINSKENKKLTMRKKLRKTTPEQRQIGQCHQCNNSHSFHEISCDRQPFLFR